MNEIDKKFLKAIFKYRKLISITFFFWLILSFFVVFFLTPSKITKSFTAIVEPNQIGDINISEIVAKNLFDRNKVSDQYYYKLSEDFKKDFPSFSLDKLKQSTSVVSYFNNEFLIKYTSKNSTEIDLFEEKFMNLSNQVINDRVSGNIEEKKLQVERMTLRIDTALGNFISEEEYSSIKIAINHLEVITKYMEEEIGSNPQFLRVIYSKTASTYNNFLKFRNLILLLIVYVIIVLIIIYFKVSGYKLKAELIEEFKDLSS